MHRKQPKQNKTVAVTVLSAVMSVLLCVAVLLSAVLQTGTDRRFYAQQQQKLGIAGALRITDEELEYLTQQTVDFLQGKRADYDVQIRGESFFYEDEQIHMKDVQRLFALARTVSLALFAVVTAYGVLLALRRRDGLWLLARGYRIACLLLVTLLSAIAAYTAANWDAAFDLFHRMLQFSDGSWVFWPGTPLVTMLPNEFFMACGVRIAVQTAGVWLVLFIVSLFVRRPKQQIEEEQR